MNVVTVAYLAVLREVRDLVAGTDAAHAALVPVSDVLDGTLDLAFDHERIVGDAIARVQVELENTGIATAFVGYTFTLAELRRVRGGVGSPPRRRKLPPKRRRRGRVGDSEWTPRPARLQRGQARGALPGRRHVAAGRADQVPQAGDTRRGKK